MRLREIGELPLLENIRAKFSRKSGSVLTGIGDDTAVLKVDGKKLLATTDMMVEGVHFDLCFTTPSQLGFKLISVNVSDIYAMGGRPRHALLGIAAPGEAEDAFIQGLLRGIDVALARYKVSLVGGDLSSTHGKTTLSATLLGYAGRPVKRSGARPGHRIYVTGNLGESACGLELLRVIGRPVDFKKPPKAPLPWDVMEPLLRRHLVPEARRPGPFVKHVSAMIDLSDGLLIDLSRLCSESGVGARLYANKIPMSQQFRAAAEFLEKDALRLATGGGEDYELLFTAPPQKKINALYIGDVTGTQGISLVGEDGGEALVEPRGYRHFSQTEHDIPC